MRCQPPPGTRRRGGRQVDVHAESLHHVSRAALGGHAAIAMFGDAHSGPGCDKCRGRRNIECAARIASGAAGVDERIASGATGIEHGVGVQFEWNGRSANGFGKAYNLFDRLAFHVQRDQQCAQFGRPCIAGKNLGHHGVRVRAGERFPVIGDAMEGVEDHEIQTTAVGEFLSNWICNGLASGAWFPAAPETARASFQAKS